MDDGNPLYRMAIFFLLILLDAIFYGFGSAVQNINESSLLHRMGEGDDKARRLLHIVNKPAHFVNTIQVSANLTGIAAGALIFGQLGRRLTLILSRGEGSLGQWLQVLSVVITGMLVLVLLISIGIVIPKRCAAEKPEKWGYALLPYVTFLMILLLPFTCLINAVAFLLLKPIGIDMAADNENVTEEDIMSMVNEGHEQGVLEAREAEMITNIFKLDDKDAGDIMAHRTNLVALDGSMTLRAAVDFILNEGYNSRYPVYGEDIDDVIGILHMKDAVIAAERSENLARPVKEIAGLLREAHFIPETRNIDSLFKEMQSGKIHMVIIVDEYGQTAGIVTMEDILEEIVGSIMDEYDVEEELITVSEDGSYLIDGMAPFDEVQKALGVKFKKGYDSYDTMNGFLISRLDRIPQEGEQTEVEYQGYSFKILQVENKMIHTILVRKLNTPAVSEKKAENGMEASSKDGNSLPG